MTEGPDHSPLTPVRPPSGASYWLGTWSGRLIVLNAIVFAVLSYKSGNVMMPDTDSLLAFGAKDPGRLAHGEWWRFLTPMFIHIGLIHFAVNSYMLYVIGYQLERLLGGRWFVLVYLASGIGGNIASAVFSTSMSAGASGAIFGLLGAGLYLERTIGRRIMEVTGRRPRNRAYLVTVAVNLAFGFVVSFIDNSAHIGGLVTGTVLTWAMVNLRPNTLVRPQRAIGVLAIVALVAAGVVGVFYGTNAEYLGARAEAAAAAATDPSDQLAHLDQAISIQPSLAGPRLKRARLYFFNGAPGAGYRDVRTARTMGATDAEIMELAKELSAAGKITEAWQVERLTAP